MRSSVCSLRAPKTESAEFAKPDRDIGAFGDQILPRIDHRHLDPQQRMQVEEFRQPRNDLPRAVEHRQRQADDASQGIDAARGVFGVLDSARISRARSRNSAPASVTVMRRVVRSSSVTPSRASSSPMMRETEGCDSPSSRAAREKLPLSAARAKTVSSCSRSFICIPNKSSP